MWEEPQLDIGGRYLSLQVAQAHEHWICTGENVLVPTQLSVNTIYLAKVMQMLFVGIQCSDQPRD